MSERPVLDPEVIESLKLLGGEDDPALFRDLVEIFIKETPPLIAKLEQALASGDAHALERAAHSLKSSSGNLGALGLSSIFRDVEMAGRAQEIERARPLVDRSRGEYVEVEHALKALL